MVKTEMDQSEAVSMIRDSGRANLSAESASRAGAFEHEVVETDAPKRIDQTSEVDASDGRLVTLVPPKPINLRYLS